MVKKIKNIRMDEGTSNRLNSLSDELGVPMGEVVAALLVLEEVQEDRELLGRIIKQAIHLEALRTFSGETAYKDALASILGRKKREKQLEDLEGDL